MGKVKILLGLVLVGTIVWSGITYSGGDKLQNVRDNVRVLNEERTTMADQITKLKDRLVEMKTEEGKTASADKNGLQAKIDQIQNEIKRLEGEVLKANKDAQATQEYVNNIMNNRQSVDEVVREAEQAINDSKTAAPTSTEQPAGVDNNWKALSSLQVNNPATVIVNSLTETFTEGTKTYKVETFINDTAGDLNLHFAHMSPMEIKAEIIKSDGSIESISIPKTKDLTLSAGDKIKLLLRPVQDINITRNN